MTVDHRRLASFAVAGYLPKPFPLETLLATIERVLASRMVTPEAERLAPWKTGRSCLIMAACAVVAALYLALVERVRG